VKLLHVYSGNLFGGIETMLVTLAGAASSAAGLHHEFALSFEGRLATELRRANRPVHDLGPARIRKPSSVLAARRALEAVVARGAYDRVICHAPWSQAFFGPIACRLGVPLVFWAHDAATGTHWTERLARRVVPGLVIATSRFVATTVSHLYPGVPTTVIHPAVSGFGLAPLGDIARRHVRAQFDTLPEDVVIVQASRLEAWKGHTLLLDALAQLSGDPRWVWWIIGGAQRPDEEIHLMTLRRAADQKGVGHRIRWIGQRDDVPQVLAAADLYCQPNLAPEPFGVVFVEALSAGLPVVTVERGGACEIVDGTCGVLVPPADPARLAAAIAELLRDGAKRANLRHAAPERARQLCDPSTQAHRLHQALLTLTHMEATA